MSRSASTSIHTRVRFAASPDRVWRGLMFYEQIAERPPLPLRLLLPRPVRADGSKATVGEDVKCSYHGGHLLKRTTRIDFCRFYEFDVVEQSLRVGSGITLSGGSYSLEARPDGGTDVALTTRYCSPSRPAFLWRPIEGAVCHMFHRHLLAAIRRKVESAEVV